MKIFLDANVLVSVLNKEYPLFPYSARVLSLMYKETFQLYTSPICLAISYYFSEKKSGASAAKRKIDLLNSKILVSEVGSEEVFKTLKNPLIQDFEDGLEYYSALKTSGEAIVSEDSNGFYFSEIPVYTCQDFLEKVVISGV
ncbi:type II toxin-antitoxin system VapC family toxin [Algoriphagus sp. PAP.12]|uniref:type II toxin-antitoxin system VapC family toxin n=1 Tax=Algoriphagus sp. PAP.12 TaxID=2996678 RepID=UPI00227D0E0A|nr:PIN domain-containing protein [Algoriphagus sp. PAP.12]